MSFNKKVISLLTGTLISSAIPVLVTPLITRVYTPSDLGEFTLYLSSTFVFSLLLTLCYEQAIVKPKSKKGVISLIYFCIFMPLLIGLLVLVIGVGVSLFFDSDVLFWLFVTIGSVITAWFNGFRYLALREDRHKIISVSLIVKAVSLAVFQLSLVDVFEDAIIISHIFSMILCVLVFMTLLGGFGMPQGRFKKTTYFYYLKKYKSFPQYTLPSALSSVAIQQSPIFFMPIVFGLKELGLYALSTRICGVPLVLIGGVLGQVYLGSAEKLKRENKEFHSLFFYIFKSLLILSVFIFLGLYILVEFFFEELFGDGFLEAKEVIFYMIPMYFFRFFSSSLSVSVIIFDKQKQLFRFNFLVFFISIINFYIFKSDFILFVKYNSLILGGLYFTQVCYFYRLHK